MQPDSFLLWLLILSSIHEPAFAISADAFKSAAATTTSEAFTLLGTDTANPASTTLCTTSMYQTRSSAIQTDLQTDLGVLFTASVANPTALLKQFSTATPHDDPAGSASRVAASTFLAHATAGTSVVHTYPGGYGQNEAMSYFSFDIVASTTLVLPDSDATPLPHSSLTNDNPIVVATRTSIVDEIILATTASNDMSATRTGSAPDTTEPPNALAVLYSALPSDVASSIASELSIDTILFYDTTATTSQSSSRTTDSSSSTSTNTVSSSTLSTITRPTSTTSSLPSATSTEAPVASSSTQLRQGSVAGIATGAAAGLVLIILTALLLLRRRSQGKPLFGALSRTGSIRSNRAYPEIAWLYDPEPAPQRTSRHYHRHDSEMTLLPTAYEGAAGVAGGDTSRGSPDLHPAGQDSPLLPPQMPLAHSSSPSGRSSSGSGRGRSARSSLQSVTRMGPIHELHEEPHIH